MSAKGDFVLGNIEVHSTQNKGHDPEFWAAQATKKIVSISDSAPGSEERRVGKECRSRWSPDQ